MGRLDITEKLIKLITMKLENFLQQYQLRFSVTRSSHRELIAKTEMLRRSDQVSVHHVTSSFDIYETNDFIVDSQSSFLEWDWNKVIEETKRMQLDYFAMRVPIDDFFPRNTDTDIAWLLVV